MHRVTEGQEAPFGDPVQKRGAQGTSGIRADFSFGYFSFGGHKFAWSEFEQPIGWPEGRKPRMVFVAKVSRLSVRDPTSKKTVALATQHPTQARQLKIIQPNKPET
jgi:hypothetical protein